MSETVTEYRLSWETPNDFHKIAAIEDFYGKHVWPDFDWDLLGEWHRTEVVFSEHADRMDQYRTLKRWAQTREQPIRNVVLEKRQVQRLDWEPA